MEASSDSVKLPDMVMCGDHPSFTKTELNAKESKDDKCKESKSPHGTHARVSPSCSRTERERSSAEQRLRATSEHALRLMEARRRVRSLDAVPRPDADGGGGLVTAPNNRALVQAALGSFRWPPYLLAVWVAVLVVTHALHGLVSMLERALPNVKKLCLYFRAWTEEAWKLDSGTNQRVLPIALALLTGLLYSLYCTLYVVHAVSLWSIEPLCTEVEEKQSANEIAEAKVTNYVDDDVNSKTNIADKHIKIGPVL